MRESRPLRFQAASNPIHRVKSLLITALIACGLFSCAKPPPPAERVTTATEPPVAIKRFALVEGQVFVTGKNGESVKLGGVEVCALDREPTETKLKAALKSERSALMAVARWESQRTDEVERYARSPNADGSKLAIVSRVIKETLANSTGNVIMSMWSGDNIASRTVSDADGRFKIAMPAPVSDYVIFAHAERTIQGVKKSVGWIVQDFHEGAPLVLCDETAFRVQTFMLDLADIEATQRKK